MGTMILLIIEIMSYDHMIYVRDKFSLLTPEFDCDGNINKASPLIKTHDVVTVYIWLITAFSHVIETAY